jgi:hypothetical protein
MKVPPLFLFTLAASVSLLSKAADPEVTKLKASYQIAVDRVVSPLKASYEQELRKLVERLTKAGNLQGALEAKTELEALTGKPEAEAGKAAVAPTSQKASDRFFVSKTWKTPTGTSFTFEKDGTGFRQFGKDKTSLIWRQIEGGLIETTLQVTQGGDVRNMYFRFLSNSEGYFGVAKDSVSKKLEAMGRQ